MDCKFRDIESDIEQWLDKHGVRDTLPGGQTCIRGYDTAKQTVLDAYFIQQAHEQLLEFALKGYRDEAFISRLSSVLLTAKDARRLTRLWTVLIADCKLSYWESSGVVQFFDTYVNDKKMSKEEAAIRHAEIVLPALKKSTLLWNYFKAGHEN